MLPKEHRLSKSAEVKQTTARGRSFFNSLFVLKYYKSSGVPRITVIASTKVSKKAVVRNKIKRVVRDVVQGYLDQLNHGNYAFIIKPPAANVTSVNLRKQLQAALIASNSLKK